MRIGSLNRSCYLLGAGVLVAVMLLLGTTGCVTRMKAISSRPAKCLPVQVYAQTNPQRYVNAGVCMFSFSAPAYALAVTEELTGVYHQDLQQNGIFRQVKPVPRSVGADAEAIWWGRHEGCDLVMLGSVLYLLDGSGATPTRLQVGVRILDVRSGTEVWNLKQDAYSEPGYDVDLGWTTISGQPAQRYHTLARVLADQFSGFLLEPIAKSKKGY